MRLATDRTSRAVYPRHTLIIVIIVIIVIIARSVARCVVVVLLGISVAVRGASGSFWRRFGIGCNLSFCAVRQLFVARASLSSVVTRVCVAG